MENLYVPLYENGGTAWYDMGPKHATVGKSLIFATWIRHMAMCMMYNCIKIQRKQEGSAPEISTLLDLMLV